MEYPIKRQLVWKANVKQFETYDRDLKQKILITPQELIWVEINSIITGWDEKSGSGIYSNRVKSIKDEEFFVKSFKGWELLRSKYSKDTKQKFEDLWAAFARSVIVVDFNEVNEYVFKWASLFQFWEDIKWIDITKYKIKFNGVDEKKKGAISYGVPRFVAWAELTADEKKAVQEAKDAIANYGKDSKEETQDLPF